MFQADHTHLARQSPQEAWPSGNVKEKWLQKLYLDPNLLFVYSAFLAAVFYFMGVECGEVVVSCRVGV